MAARNRTCPISQPSWISVVLVLDNYDSFTFNLVQALGALGSDPVVVRNDEQTVDEIRSLAPSRIVVSPGPCTPREAGVSVELIRALGPEIPTLGVCLGHQAVGEAFGGRTVQAGRMMHGKTAPVRHGGDTILAGLPSPFTVARYHSLVTDPSSLPSELEAIAWTDVPGEEDEVQAVRHRRFPVFGVQFHPESLFGERGDELLKNFLAV